MELYFAQNSMSDSGQDNQGCHATEFDQQDGDVHEATIPHQNNVNIGASSSIHTDNKGAIIEQNSLDKKIEEAIECRPNPDEGKTMTKF